LQSLNEWFVSSLFFWVFLAGMEVTGALLVNGFPPPLGKGSMPTAMDVNYLVVAVSLYALLGILTALILLWCETICSWLKEKTAAPSLDLNRMDLYLLFAFGLLYFKWISQLMPYLTDADHLPRIPYLLIAPLLGIHLWASGFSKKTSGYYQGNWIVIFVGTIFMSKTAYDLFISSSLSLAVKGSVFISLLLGTLLSARFFYTLLNRMLLRRSRITIISALLFLCLLIGGFITTWRAVQRENRGIPFLAKTNHVHSGEGKAGKNVVLVVVDCLRPDHLECYGYEKKTSPFIDRAAESGALFEDCIAPSSWTIPSVVSLFTGVYPQEHGVNAPGTLLPDSLTTFQETLQQHMINTAAFITNDYLNPRFGFDRGFSHYYNHYLQQELGDYVASRLFFLNAFLHFKNELLYPYSVDPGGARWWSVGLPPFNHAKRSAKRVTDDALYWIDSQGDKPFFMYLHYMDVHSPYDTIWYPLFDSKAYPGQDVEGKLTNTYDGRIAYVDRQIERIWEALVNCKLSEETLLIITADHGEELYDHGGTGHCTTLYDELIRVPLIMINTSGGGVGKRVQRQIQLIDVPVTILDFLDITVPDQMNGKSLLPLLENAPPLHESRYALSYTTRGRKSLQTEEGRALWERKVWDQGGILTSLRIDGRWKIIRGEDGQSELFNLHKDQGEHNNVKAMEEVLFEDLKKKLMEASSTLQRFTPRQEKLELSPDTRNKLRALGYL
jgi:arylsulfatase A-like enzyme